jgi:tetrahydromethanopterin S-methyltransferase subunit B
MELKENLNVEDRLTNLEKMVQEIQNKLKCIDSKWPSLREKWTVIAAVSILVACFFIIAVVALFGQSILVDKLITAFNAFIMAVLGYLFGYVPTKSSEESIKIDKEITDEKLGKIESALDEYKEILSSKDKIIKDYEKIVALYNTET